MNIKRITASLAAGFTAVIMAVSVSAADYAVINQSSPVFVLESSDSLMGETELLSADAPAQTTEAIATEETTAQETTAASSSKESKSISTTTVIIVVASSVVIIAVIIIIAAISKKKK